VAENGIRNFFIVGLAAIGAYAVFQWWERNPRAAGPSNPVATEVGGVAHSNVTDSGQMTSGIPVFNARAIANGHGDQVSAAYHSNPTATLPGGPQYTPAFGPEANTGGRN
jgi:hypothetical protein